MDQCKGNDALWVILALSMVGTGCASTGATGKPWSKPECPTGKSIVVFYRPNEFQGHRAYYHVSTEQEDVVSVTNGGYFDYVVDPGPHTYQIEEYAAAGILGAAMNPSIAPSCSFSVDCDPGEIYYVRIRHVLPGADEFASEFGRALQFKGPEKVGAEIEVIGEKEALEELQKLKRFDPGRKDYQI